MRQAIIYDGLGLIKSGAYFLNFRNSAKERNFSSWRPSAIFSKNAALNIFNETMDTTNHLSHGAYNETLSPLVIEFDPNWFSEFLQIDTLYGDAVKISSSLNVSVNFQLLNKCNWVRKSKTTIKVLTDVTVVYIKANLFHFYSNNIQLSLVFFGIGSMFIFNIHQYSIWT
jgi:hypothetical protein